jgi:hypothetical protein
VKSLRPLTKIDPEGEDWQMALRIIRATEPIQVDTIVLTVYAPPGVGKTSLAFSAHAPLLLDTDQGAYRSAFRKDAAEARSWADIAGIGPADVKPYKTLVLDTAGRALDLLSTDIIAGNPKLGRGGALTLQGYGELKTRFAAYLNLMRSFGLDIVLVAHSDEKQQGDETIERIDMQGSSKQEVYKSSDAMARLGVVGGKRVLMFSPTETRFGKDPAAIGVVHVPHLGEEPEFLGGVIQHIKDTLNALSSEQVAAAAAAKERAAEWSDHIEAAETPDQFTALIGQAQDDAEKRQLHEAATAAGFAYNKKKKAYVGEPAGAEA